MKDRVYEASQAVNSLHAAIDSIRYAARDMEGKELLIPMSDEIQAAMSRLTAFIRYELMLREFAE